MKKINIGQSGLYGSQIALGCMRILGMESEAIRTLVHTCMEEGITFFDHADIYGGGQCEEAFSNALAMKPSFREKIIIQTKCAIANGYFDFSKEHILNSVEGSLKRLNTDYIDVLLLHRPDTLMEPDEVADAFDTLKSSGKVRHFGVSNQKPGQIRLLQKSLNVPIIANQLQFSIAHTGMIDAGFNVNMKNEKSIDHDSEVLEFCRLKEITIQPWSPFQHGFFNGSFIGNDDYKALNDKLKELGTVYDLSPTAMAIAWILHHPAKMQPIVGTTNVERIRQIAKASDVAINRQEWYEIYKSAGNILP